MDSLDMIQIAVNELTNPQLRRDREANRPPALLYAHMTECLAREPHMNVNVDWEPKKALELQDLLIDQVMPCQHTNN